MRPDFGYFEEKKLGKPYDVRLLKRLYPFTRRYRLLLFGSILLVLLITAMDLAMPYVTKVAIDRYIVPQAGTAKNRRAAAGATPQRYLTVTADSPAIRTLIARYPNLFIVTGNNARILYVDLGRLTKADLRLLRRQDLNGLAVIAAIFLALVVANFGLNFFQKMIMEYTGHMIMHDLRMQLFVHIQSLAVEFFTRNPVARLVTRTTNDVQNMHELFTSVISLVFKDLFLLGGIAATMLVLNWKLALVSFTVLPLVVYAAFNFSVRARDIFRQLRIKVAQINTRFAETIGGIRVIQLFGQKNRNYRAFKTLNHENYLAGMRQIHVLAVFMPLIELLGVVAVATVIYYGGGRVGAGTLSLGALVAFISYIKMFFRPIRDLAEKYNILQNAMASAERLFLILDTRNRLSPAAAAAGGRRPDLKQIDEIRFEKVDFGYVPKEMVLRDISFTIRRGEAVAVVGPTGAGKTSLINLICRFHAPAAGRILINGRDINAFDISALRSKLALVMQDPFLFSGTIRENIFQNGKDGSERQARAVIAAAHCDRLIERAPDGLDTVLAEGGASISSGERQLISIARALARQPQLILFDEATSYIDSPTERLIQQALEKLMQNRTALIVAHRLSTVRHADRIMVLNRGRIIEIGNHGQLMAREGFYFRLHQLQNKI